MNEPKFTPGPWLPHVAFNEADGFPEFCVDCGGCATKHDMYLIAAAPELYEALELLVSYGDVFAYRAGTENPYLKGRAALAKARGES